MKKSRMLLTGVAVGLLGLGLTGCQDEEKVAPPATPEPEIEPVAPPENPAQQKPRDHPAH